jgi:hypothetical protein
MGYIIVSIYQMGQQRLREFGYLAQVIAINIGYQNSP